MLERLLTAAAIVLGVYASTFSVIRNCDVVAMQRVFMVLGQSAATAAYHAIDERVPA